MVTRVTGLRDHKNYISGDQKLNDPNSDGQKWRNYMDTYLDGWILLWLPDDSLIWLKILDSTGVGGNQTVEREEATWANVPTGLG
jgi:hypothetical protein